MIKGVLTFFWFLLPGICAVTSLRLVVRKPFQQAERTLVAIVFPLLSAFWGITIFIRSEFAHIYEPIDRLRFSPFATVFFGALYGITSFVFVLLATRILSTKVDWKKELAASTETRLVAKGIVVVLLGLLAWLVMNLTKE